MPEEIFKFNSENSSNLNSFEIGNLE